MKKGEKYFIPGKRRVGHWGVYQPVTKGEILKVNKDSIEIMLEDTVVPSIIPIERVKNTGKKHKMKDEELEELIIERVENAI
jgi:ribosomal protein S1